MSEQEGFVPIDEVAKYFSVSISTVRVWIRKKRIPKHTYIKLGTTYRFKISAMEEALTAENKSSDEPETELMKLY
jgi:excisionase family DNA binding protein